MNAQLARECIEIYRKLDKNRDMSIEIKSMLFKYENGKLEQGIQYSDVRSNIILMLDKVEKHIEFLDWEIMSAHNTNFENIDLSHLDRRFRLLKNRHTNNKQRAMEIFGEVIA